MNRTRRTGLDQTRQSLSLSSPTATLESWEQVPPLLEGSRVTLREVDPSDGAALLSSISTTEVARFISPPPDTVAAFEQFIAKSRQRRAAGDAICFAVVPAGYGTPVGLFQVRRPDPQGRAAEWGFALGAEFWGEGLFSAAAPLVIDWVFETLGVLRLEARSAATNSRGNGALRKLGAVQEAVLRGPSARDADHFDQVLWTVTADHWRTLRPNCRLQVH
jgi:[ribosomal protein S5]-alanine N-acetyltransferase